jgi:hypothetical protein
MASIYHSPAEKENAAGPWQRVSFRFADNPNVALISQYKRVSQDQCGALRLPGGLLLLT